MQNVVKAFFVKEKYKTKRRNYNWWLFGEWFGEKCCDNSFYLANYIAENHKNIKVFWATNNNTSTYKLKKNITIVRFDDSNISKLYKNVGVVFMNQNYKDFSNNNYNYFSGAITVNLWHGVMWKRIGHDGNNNTSFLKKIYSRILDYTTGQDYYLSVSNEYSNKIQSAFGANKNRIIKAGYPRNSIFYEKDNLSEAREVVLKQIRSEYKTNIDKETKIITYMPTFRDHTNNVFSFNDLDNKDLYKLLKGENAIIIQKAHFINQKSSHFDRQSFQKRIFELDSIDAQIILAATDLLITDYSSCFFDFLLLDKPIIHFLYDYDYYEHKDRGLYYNYSDVCCGDAVFSIDALVKAIKSNLENPGLNHLLRQKRRKKFMTFESPDSCFRIYDQVEKIIKEI